MKSLWEFAEDMFWLVAMIPLALIMGVASGIYALYWWATRPFAKNRK